MKYVGCDVSKNKLDLNYINNKGQEVAKKIKNDLSSIEEFYSEIDKDFTVCAENTGVYSELLSHCGYKLGYDINIVPNTAIKYGSGSAKGKSDAIDARRIRKFAERFQNELYIYKPKNETLLELRELLSLRELMIRDKVAASNHSTNRGSQIGRSIFCYNILKEQLINYKTKVDNIDAEIQNLIKMDKGIYHNYELLEAVPLGKILATYLILYTENFKKITSASNASKYFGLYNYPNESGTSYQRPKPKLSMIPIVKSKMYLCCLRFIKKNGIFRDYYDRKKKEGKHHYLVMNNLMNKLLRIIYAVIRDGNYIKNYTVTDPRNNGSD